VKDLNKIIKHIYLPVFIGIITIIGIYSLLNYILIIRYHLIEPKEMLLNLFIPFGIAGLFAYLYIRPKLKFLIIQDNTREFLTFFCGVILAVPLIISQHYIDVKNGKLTKINSTSVIYNLPETKYYEIDNYFAFKDYGSYWTSRRASNKYGTEITVTAYFTCPMVDTLAYYKSPEDFVIWIGKEYYGKFGNRKWDMVEQPEKVQRFIDKCINEFKVYDFHPQSYFKRLQNSNDRDNFLFAIERVPYGKAISKKAIILVPEKGSYVTRTGNILVWFVGTFIIGQLVFFFLIFKRALKTTSLNKFNKLEPIKKVKESIGLLIYLIPTKERFVTSIILDINIIVLLLMIISGADVVSPSSRDLIHWGANFKPLVQEGEWWRIITSIFVHIGLFHLMFNIIGLALVGFQMDKELSVKEYIIFYLLTGIIASITSLLFHDKTISAGASGAIMGLYGVGISMLILKIGSGESRAIFSLGLIVIVLSTLLMGLVTPSDNSAHLGGLVSGFFLGLVYFPFKKFINEFYE
jgi:rhomboid protease GluP